MSTFTLPDGRALAYVDGDPAGAPVVLFHGAPGSRAFRPPESETAAAGVRLVTFDRPGYGGSDPVAAPTVLGAAHDTLALADALGLERFAVVAWSGGAPSGVATAYLAPDRVRSLALVSGPGPLDEVPGGWEALGDLRRPTAEMARRDPHRSMRAIARTMEPFLADPVSFLGRGRGPDAAILADPVLGAMLREQVTLALAPGAAGIASDLVAMWLPFGFALADVRVPTAVFHAELDPHNAEDAEVLATRIPGARLACWPDTGHLGMLTHWPEVLAAVT